MNTKKLLIIAPEFGKDSGAGATNNFHLALALSNLFATCVLTVHRGGRKESYLSYKNLKIKYSSLGLIHSIVYFFRNMFSYVSNNNHSFTTKKGNKEVNPINYYILFRLKKKFLIPDTFIDWLPIGIWEGFRYIKKEKVDAIISSATPYTSHLVSYILSKLFNLPLVLYYQDPWVIEKSIKRGNFRFRFEFYLEKKIVSAAKLLIFCTESTRQEYLRLFRLDPNRTSVVYFGFDPKDFDYSLVPDESNNINLVYGGRIVPGQRDVNPLLNALNKLPGDFPLHIDLFIREGCLYYRDLAKKLSVEKFVSIFSPLTHKEFCQRLRRYDYLILLGNIDPLQIPSKLYEYIGSRRPIFLIQNNQSEDETFKIVKSMNNSIIAKNKVEDIKNALYKMIEFKKSSKILQTSIDFASRFIWHEREREYLGLIKNVINNEKINRRG